MNHTHLYFLLRKFLRQLYWLYGSLHCDFAMTMTSHFSQHPVVHYVCELFLFHFCLHKYNILSRSRTAYSRYCEALIVRAYHGPIHARNQFEFLYSSSISTLNSFFTAFRLITFQFHCSHQKFNRVHL